MFLQKELPPNLTPGSTNSWQLAYGLRLLKHKRIDHLGPFSLLPGIGSLADRSRRGCRFFRTIVSLSNQSAILY